MSHSIHMDCGLSWGRRRKATNTFKVLSHPWQYRPWAIAGVLTHAPLRFSNFFCFLFSLLLLQTQTLESPFPWRCGARSRPGAAGFPGLSPRRPPRCHAGVHFVPRPLHCHLGVRYVGPVACLCCGSPECLSRSVNRRSIVYASWGVKKPHVCFHGGAGVN